MAVAVWAAFGMYLLLGLVYGWLARRMKRFMEASPELRRQQLASLSRKRRQTVVVRVRAWLIGLVVQARLYLWWPASAALGIAIQSRTPQLMVAKARVRSVEVTDGLLLVVGVGALVLASTRSAQRLPLALWTILFLAIIGLRNLRILLQGNSYFNSVRATPGHPYARFNFVAISDACCLIGLSFVVTALDNGLPLALSRESAIDVPLAMLPHNVVRAFLSSYDELSVLRLTVNVAALLTYFLLLTQVLRAHRFRRTREDCLAIAYAYIRLGEYGEARRWINKVGPTPLSSRYQVFIDIGSGRLDRAWAQEEQFLLLLGQRADPDMVWYNLYIFTKDLPISQEVRLKLFAMGIVRGVTDGTLAMAVDQSIVTGFDPRGIEIGLRAEGVDLERLPVTQGTIRLLIGELDEARVFFAGRDYAPDEWTGHVAALFLGLIDLVKSSDRSSAGGTIASQAVEHTMFNIAADAVLRRIGAADLSLLTPGQRMYLCFNLGVLHDFASKIHPKRSHEIKLLIDELAQGTGFTTAEVLANQRSIMNAIPGTQPLVSLAGDSHDRETYLVTRQTLGAS